MASAIDIAESKLGKALKKNQFNWNSQLVPMDFCYMVSTFPTLE